MFLQKTHHGFSDYFWFNRLMLEICGVLPSNKGYLIDVLLTSCTLVSISFIVFPGIYNIALGGNKIEILEEINIIGETLEILFTAIKGKSIQIGISVITMANVGDSCFFHLIYPIPAFLILHPYKC